MTEKSKAKPLVLVDGSSYLFRAYHAMPPLTNSKGNPTGAIYGVINMLRSLIKQYTPEYIAVVFDAKGKTFRDELFAQYKANRPPMPDELRIQIEPLHAIVQAMGLPMLIIDGVEADDVIGTLAVQAQDAGLDTVISTGDKDMAQLVNEHISLINTMNNTRLDIQGVVDKFGVTPGQMIDYLALIGDTSDNIPGIPGVGPKTAVKWLKKYSSLDNIVTHAGDISGKIGEKLRANIDQLPLSRQLATIICDVPLEITGKGLKQKPPDSETLCELYQQLEFKKWLTEVLNPANASPTGTTPVSTTPASTNMGPNEYDTQTDIHSSNAQYDIIYTEKAFDAWIKKLEKADLFAFDTETTSLAYMDAEIVGVSVAVRPGEAAYIPVAHDYEGAPSQLSRDAVLERLRHLLEDPKKNKLGQHLKYDMNVLANYDIKMAGIRFDTMLESYVLNSTVTRHDMDSLALKYLGYRTIHFEDVAGKGVKQVTFNQVDLAIAGPYAAEDADITLQLHQKLFPEISNEKTLKNLLDDVEMPLVPVLSRIERNGVLVDEELLKQQSLELSKRADDIGQQAFELVGQQFNLASPKQIQEILFEKQGLPVLHKTPKGQPSTAESVLQELALDYPLPKLILEYRSLTKLKSTYTDKLPEQINQYTGRVHTSYHQAVATTGRLSSSDPNLQNIPIRTEEGRRIRQAFIAPPGYKLLAADYSQIELRILAHLSQDEGLLNAFKNDDDIHDATAAEIFAISPNAVTPDQRRSAKAVNFGLIYGMSAFGLGKQLGIGRTEAQEYMDVYFARYPQVKTFMDNMRSLARDQGYVETLLGRRLYLQEIHSRNAQRRQYAERAAINAPMQGSAADIIKLAMLKTDAAFSDAKHDIKMIMQVHDELVFEIAEDQVEMAVPMIEAFMTDAVSLSVPLKIHVGIGDNWDQAH